MKTKENESPEYGSTSGCLVRVYWMALGNVILLFCAFGILQNDSSLFGIADAFYWAVVGSVLAARYVDVRYLGGMTADGHPASWGHWRRYAVLLLAGCTAVWLVLHAAAWLY